MTRASKRLFIAAGVENYAHLADADLTLVPTELRRLSDAMAQLGYRQILPKLTRNPTKSDFVAAIANQLKMTPKESEAMLVFYFTGHGHDDGDRHYLLLSDSNPDDLDGTALPVEELARLLIKKRRFRQTLIILDVCYAGRGKDDIAAIFQRLNRTFSTYLGTVAFLLASARSWEAASQCAFSEAFAAVVLNEDGQWGGKTQQFLYPDAIVGAVNSLLPKPSQQAVLTALDVTDRCLLFPNRKYDATVPVGLDLESQRSREFAEHWIPRAHGTEFTSNISYFSGRERALRELVAWLTSDDPSDTLRVVTGAPGAGKSAILARLVTLSDSKYRRAPDVSRILKDLPRDTLPPEGIVDVAVHARGKTLDQIAEIVAEKTGLHGPASRSAEGILLTLKKRRKRIVIAVDALDEAVGPRDIVSTFISKLIEVPRIRILVGTRHVGSRSSRFVVPGLGRVDDTIDLDLPKYNKSTDVLSYVRSRLLSIDEPWVKTPYRNRPQMARKVAEAIAAKAGNNYLCARIVCNSVINADHVVNIDDGNWREQFPNDVGQAFDGFLRRLDELNAAGFNKRIATDLLLPLAYGEGEGLPRGHLWTALANAISEKNYKDKPDLSNLLNYAAAYIVESSENGRSVYRLYHQALADYLRRVAPPDTYSRVSKILLHLTPDLMGQPGKDWSIADPYVCTHIATYLSKAGMVKELESLVVDVRYLIRADSERLLRVLGGLRGKESRQAASIYHQAYMTLHTDRVVATLTEREQKILRSRFHLDAETRSGKYWVPRRYKEVAAELGLSLQIVRRVEAGALRQLRQTGRSGRPVPASLSLADRVVPASYLKAAARYLGYDAFAERVTGLGYG